LTRESTQLRERWSRIGSAGIGEVSVDSVEAREEENEAVAPQPGGPRVAPRRVEWFLALAVALLLAAAAIPGVQSTSHGDLAEATVRGVEGLLRQARDEAVRTGEDHIVFFEQMDIEQNGMEQNGIERSGIEQSDDEQVHQTSAILNHDTNQDKGERYMAMLIRDRDGDGRASDSEFIASIPADTEGIVRWGSALATMPASGDVAGQLRGPLSFGRSDSQIRERGLVFRSDGAPHAVESKLDAAGDSGAGTVYLHGPTRDYAVVLSPWGDVDLQVWDTRSQSWRPFSTP
jgi:hypothetical protein